MWVTPIVSEVRGSKVKVTGPNKEADLYCLMGLLGQR